MRQMMPLSTDVSPLNVVCVGSGIAFLYAVLVGLWRWCTYEARTAETYLRLAALAVAPLLPLCMFVFTSHKSLEGCKWHLLLAALLLGWDAYVLHRIWRNFVVGPRFQSVDLHGKVAIVTGANTGIGRETSRFLAEMGATVILACRSKDRAEEAIRAILWESGSKIKPSQLEFWPLDVSSLQSVGDFAAAFQEKAGHKGLDILINNAGVMLNERRLTSEGLEATLATNHFGHFLLTLLLFPELEKVSDGRVVNVSSSLHKVPRAFNFDDPLYESSAYSLFGAYGQSKLANVLFTFELQRRLEVLQSDEANKVGRKGERGGGDLAVRRVVTANAVHPGNVQTEVARNMPWYLYWGQRICSPILWCFSKNPAQGAYTSVHVATSPALRGIGGKFFVNCDVTGDVSAVARDPSVAGRLWAMSEEACGLTAATGDATVGSSSVNSGPQKKRKTNAPAGTMSNGDEARHTTPKTSLRNVRTGANGSKGTSPGVRRSARLRVGGRAERKIGSK